MNNEALLRFVLHYVENYWNALLLLTVLNETKKVELLWIRLALKFYGI